MLIKRTVLNGGRQDDRREDRHIVTREKWIVGSHPLSSLHGSHRLGFLTSWQLSSNSLPSGDTRPLRRETWGNLSPKLYPQHMSMSIFSQHSIYRTLCKVLKLYQTHGLCSSCRLLLQIVQDLLLVTSNPSESLTTLTGTYSVNWDAVFFGLGLSFLICIDLEESMNLQMELCCLALQYAEAYMLSKARSLLK